MLGKNIKKLRSALGWSQVELAKKLNITKQTVSNWENDNIQPSIEMLVRISKVFGVTTDSLLGLENSNQVNVSGLSESAVAHLLLLIDDLRSGNISETE